MTDITQALERVRLFNLRFKRRQVEPKPERPGDGVVYGKVSKKLTRNRLFQNVIDREIPTPAENEIRDQLYPRRGEK